MSTESIVCETDFPNRQVEKNRVFGKLLKEFLTKNALSQSQLGEAIPLDRTYVSRICSGERIPDRQLTLKIIRYLYDVKALKYEEEATALLEAAGHARLREDDGVLTILRQADQSRQLPKRAPLMPNPPDQVPPPKNMLPWHSIVQGIQKSAIQYSLVAVMTLIMVGFGLRAYLFKPLIWEEDFNPIHKHWEEVSARWEDGAGAAAILRENDPNNTFGKVESEVIVADITNYPILRIDVANIEKDASYTVQILDKRTNEPKDVLRGIAFPGEQQVNLAYKMEWSGIQQFTINLWINGENKSVTIHFIRLESE